MLCQKDSQAPNALYVNIFAVHPVQLTWNEKTHEMRQAEIDISTLQKDDQLSQLIRTEGNGYFNIGEWSIAMKTYNDSLCYAVEGSPNVSFAYANRASCFMKLKFFKEALEDIKMAKDSGYPSTLMHKLNSRETECLEQMKNGTRLYKQEAELSFDPDDHFPCMADVLKIEKGTNGDYKIIAKEDIDVGQTIVVENSFNYLHGSFGLKCNTCLKDHVNLVPCNKCCVAMFCSTECQRSSVHSHECGMKLSNDGHFNVESMRIVRSIFEAMKLFSSADELTEFVERTLANDDLPTSLLDDRSKYRAMLKQRIGRKFLDIVDLGEKAFPVYKALLKDDKVNEMFSAEKHRRFLMHLIGHHIQIFHHNSDDVIGQMQAQIGRVGLMSRYFNHSCFPHAFMVSDIVGNVVHVTVRPIKQGQEVSTLYNPCFLLLDRAQRQCRLWELRKIRCKCERCEGAVASYRQRQQLAGELGAFGSITNIRSDKDIVEAKGQYIRFLRKYGNYNWCDEMREVMVNFLMLLSAHLTVK